MSIEAIDKIDQRKLIDRLLPEYLARGGVIEKVPKPDARELLNLYKLSITNNTQRRALRAQRRVCGEK